MTKEITTILTMDNIAQLTAILMGGGKKRQKDKATAIDKFRDAAQIKFGIVRGVKIASAAFACVDFAAARLLIEQAKHSYAGGRHAPPETEFVKANKALGKREAKHAQKIYPLIEDNPRRPDTFGHISMAIVLNRPGITIGDYLKAGGRMKDLNWDILHESVKIDK